MCPSVSFPGKCQTFQRAGVYVCQTALATLQQVCLRSCPGHFLQCMRFLMSPALFPCLHWLNVAETGYCFFKQIRSSMPTGISCLQGPPFTRYQLFENICVLPHQNNLPISNVFVFFFSSNIVFFSAVMHWGRCSLKSKHPIGLS